MAGLTELPSFMIIGAAKAATTWLNVQLRDHPDIFTPSREPHFFSTEYYRGEDFYRSLFASADPGQIVGEKSADYLAHSNAPARAAALLPSTQIVVQLRNPIERAYSDYKMLFRRGTIQGPPEAYLRHGSSQPRFLLGGLYARHLQRWFDYFASAQLCILLHEDVCSAPRETVTRVCAHVGARPFYSDNVGTRAVNDGTAQLLPLGVRRLLSPLKPFVRPLRGTAVFEQVRGVLAREVAYPPLSPGLRARLSDYYAQDIAELSAMIGRPLQHWLNPQPIADSRPIRPEQHQSVCARRYT